MGAFNTCAAEDGDPFGCIEQDGSRLLTIIGGAHNLGTNRIGPDGRCGLLLFRKISPGITTTAAPLRSIAVRMAISSTRGSCSGSLTSSL